MSTNWEHVLNPRRELLTLLSAALEVCWAFAYFAQALFSGGHPDSGVSIWLLAVLTLCAIYTARLVLNSGLAPGRRRAVIGVFAVGSVLLAMRVSVFSRFGPFDLEWLSLVGRSVANLFIAFSTESVVLVMGAFAWWRGVTLAQTSLDFESVGFRFRLGVLLLALAVLLNTWHAKIDLAPLTFAFFFCALMAVALARQEDLARSGTSISLPLKGPWLAILAVSALLVLGLAVFIASALTPQTFRALFDLLRPLEPLVVLVLYAVLFVAALLMEIVFSLVLLVINRVGSGTVDAPPFQLPTRPPLLPEQSPTDFGAIAAYLDPLRMVCAVVLIAGILIALSLSLSKLQQSRISQGGETREGVPVSIDLNPLRRLRGLFRRPRRVEAEDSVTSVRRIYAHLARLAGRLGFPRREAATPYEYVHDLRAAIPNADMEERLITEAYVRVHYGEHLPSEDEVAQVRQAWDNIKRRSQLP